MKVWNCKGRVPGVGRVYPGMEFDGDINEPRIKRYLREYKEATGEDALIEYKKTYKKAGGDEDE